MLLGNKKQLKDIVLGYLHKRPVRLSRAPTSQNA
jgi:hypothetical protein